MLMTTAEHLSLSLSLSLSVDNGASPLDEPLQIPVYMVYYFIYYREKNFSLAPLGPGNRSCDLAPGFFLLR